MAGIYGIISFNDNNYPSIEQLDNMKVLLIHRGPDGEGLFHKGQVAIGCTRFKVLDLSQSADKPMSNETGKVWMVCDGRVYNFSNLKTELIRLGHQFISRLDTEVILHAYEEWGIDCLERIDGAFAFVIWDENTRTVFAARDRFGEKPFFYSFVNGCFFFASELTALMTAFSEKPGINPVALDQYLTYLYILPPNTIYTGVFQLPAANFLILNCQGSLEVNPYWKLSFAEQNYHDPVEIEQEIRSLIHDAVSQRMYSDAPVGALLSGGIDSAVVVATMSELSGSPVNTFTIGTTDPSMDEAGRARLVSEKFNTQHHEFYVKPEAAEILPKLIKHYGQPYADSSAIPTYYASKLAGQHVKVVLSGDAGDHMFGGFRYRYAWFLDHLRSLPRPFSLTINEFSKIAGSFPKNKVTSRLVNLNHFSNINESLAFATCYSMGLFQKRSTIYNSNFKSSLEKENAVAYYSRIYSGCDGGRLLDRWINADILTSMTGDVLTKVDIASMACSLEMRAPFLDRRLTEFFAQVPSDMKLSGRHQKILIKRAFKDILPETTLNHQKTGFSIPIKDWLRNELVGYVDDLIINNQSEVLETYLNPKEINNLILDQRNGNDSLSSQVWSILNLVLWEKMFIDDSFTDIKSTTKYHPQ